MGTLRAMASSTLSRVSRPRGEADTRLVAQIVEENAERSTLVFGSPSDAYSIARFYERYASGSVDLEETRSPSTLFWSLYENDRCTPIESWPVGGDMNLNLCLGWDEEVAQ